MENKKPEESKVTVFGYKNYVPTTIVRNGHVFLSIFHRPNKEKEQFNFKELTPPYFKLAFRFDNTDSINIIIRELKLALFWRSRTCMECGEITYQNNNRLCGPCSQIYSTRINEKAFFRLVLKERNL